MGRVLVSLVDWRQGVLLHVEGLGGCVFVRQLPEGSIIVETAAGQVWCVASDSMVSVDFKEAE